MLANLTWGEAPVQPPLEDAGGLPHPGDPVVPTLHEQELALARTLPAARRHTFVAGRLALRRALIANGAIEPTPILRTPRGGPQLPDRLTGSISHKQSLAIAAVAPRTRSQQHVGIDLERRPTEADLQRPSIGSRILLPNEQQRIAAMASSPRHHRELELVHFALKEAVYKAIDPIVQRYVGFLEVEVTLTPETDDAGGAAPTLHMPEFATRPHVLTAAWRLTDEWIVVAAAIGEPGSP